MALAIPSMLLKQLYTFGSLKNTPDGVRFSVKNRLSDATLTGLDRLKIGNSDVPLQAATIDLGGGTVLTLDDLAQSSLDFPLRRTPDIHCAIEPLPLGKHKIEVQFATKPFDKLKLKVGGAVSEEEETLVRIPRSGSDDYADQAITERHVFVEKLTGQSLKHTNARDFVEWEREGDIRLCW